MSNDFQNKFRDILFSEHSSSSLLSIIGGSCRIELINGVATFICQSQDSFEKLTKFQIQIKQFTISKFPEATDLQIRMETESEKAQRVKIDEEEAAKRKAEYDEERRLQRIDDLIENSNLPLITKTTRRFDNYKVVAGNKEAYVLAKEFAAETGKRYHHLLTFHGGTGTGKTHLALAIGWDFVLVRLKSVKYYQCQRLFDKIKSSFGTSNDHELIRKCESVNLLILDDIAAEKKSEWTDATLDALVDFRYINGLPTVLTTNETEITPRIDSRLAEGNIVTLTVPDYRKIKSVQRAKGIPDASPKYSDIKSNDSNDGMEGMRSI
jgi:DNA replication protein DnaC